MNYTLIREKKVYLEFRDFLNPDIISDCTHNDSGFVITTWQLHLTNLWQRKKINVTN